MEPPTERMRHNREEMARAGLEAFFNIAEKWALSPEEQRILLGIDKATFLQWQQEPPSRLSEETLERLSHLLGIYKNLHFLLQKPEDADAWVRRPNQHPLFKGASALERMLAGGKSDLLAVRQHLEGHRDWIEGFPANPQDG